MEPEKYEVLETIGRDSIAALQVLIVRVDRSQGEGLLVQFGRSNEHPTVLYVIGTETQKAALLLTKLYARSSVEKKFNISKCLKKSANNSTPSFPFSIL